MNNYEISSKTMAIIPIAIDKCKIIEEENSYIINKNPTSIIEHSCKYYGSTYKGRKEGTKELIGINYKIPVIIESSRNIIFFPTTSVNQNSCCWISLNQIKSYQKYLKYSKIIFKNDYELCLNISYGSLENQILRSSLLENTIIKRIKTL